MRITRRKKIRQSSDVDRWSAEFETLCRSRGIRVTPQRLAVYRTLAEDLTHPSADLVYQRMSERLPGMSRATVYRTLEFLERENLIRRVSAPGAAGRVDANIDRHQHLFCRVCGSMQDVTLPELHPARLPAVSGFKVEELDIRLVGRCRECSKPGFNRRFKQLKVDTARERKPKS